MMTTYGTMPIGNNLLLLCSLKLFKNSLDLLSSLSFGNKLFMFSKLSKLRLFIHPSLIKTKSELINFFWFFSKLSSLKLIFSCFQLSGKVSLRESG